MGAETTLVKKIVMIAILLLAVFASVALGRQGFFGNGRPRMSNGPSGGRCLVPGAGDFREAAREVDQSGFVYARLRYHPVDWWRQRTPEVPWHHDYPDGDTMFPTSLERLTEVHTSKDAYQIVDIDSKDLFKYPFIYLPEPGLLDLSPGDVKNLKEYLERGGFIMIDDFRGNPSDNSEMENLVVQLKKMYPDRSLEPVPASHPIFNIFFEVDPTSMLPPYTMSNSGDVQFLGMSDDRGRLQIMVDFNNDTSEYWQALDIGSCSIKEAGTAVELGVNYALYAMSH